jgi:hypothetical protein
VARASRAAVGLLTSAPLRACEPRLRPLSDGADRDRPRQDHIRNAEFECRRTAKLLSKALGSPVTVTHMRLYEFQRCLRSGEASKWVLSLIKFVRTVWFGELNLT